MNIFTSEIVKKIAEHIFKPEKIQDKNLLKLIGKDKGSLSKSKTHHVHVWE